MSSPTEKSSYAGSAWQMMYNAKAAVSSAFRKDIKQVLDTSDIHNLGQAGQGEDWLQRCCRNIQYFSYRNKLPVPIGTAIDHDAGWGCMVRTGQMMLCVALKRSVKILHGRGRSPSTMSTLTHIDGEEGAETNNTVSNASVAGPGGMNRTASNNNNNNKDNTNEGGLSLESYSEFCRLNPEEQINCIINMFRDIPQADFSIHAIVHAGSKYHIQPGEWFNATALALSLKHLILMRDNCPVTAVHGMESTVNLNDILNAAGTGKPVLVMVSVMLGMSNISPKYYPAVHEVLGHEASVGIVGGKPKKSMYFFASQKETLFMLDPHYVQPAFTQKVGIGLQYGSMDWVPMGEADSSMLVCFLLEPKQEAIELWAQWVEQRLSTLSEYPLFSVNRKKGKLNVPANNNSNNNNNLSGSSSQKSNANNNNNTNNFSAPKPTVPKNISSKSGVNQQGSGTSKAVANRNNKRVFEDEVDFDNCDDDDDDFLPPVDSGNSSNSNNNNNASPNNNPANSNNSPAGTKVGNAPQHDMNLDPALDALLGGGNSNSNNNTTQPLGFEDL